MAKKRQTEIAIIGDEFLADAPTTTTDPNKIAKVLTLVDNARKLAGEIEALQAELSRLSEQYERLATAEVPEAMTEARMKNYTFTDGTVLSLKDFMSVSIPEANRPKAYAFLRKNGAGDLIKRQIAVLFGMGQDKAAEALKAKLKKLSPIDKTTVAAPSLSAWARERQEKGKPIPEDIFKVYAGRKMVLTTPKEK